MNAPEPTRPSPVDYEVDPTSPLHRERRLSVSGALGTVTGVVVVACGLALLVALTVRAVQALL